MGTDPNQDVAPGSAMNSWGVKEGVSGSYDLKFRQFQRLQPVATVINYQNRVSSRGLVVKETRISRQSKPSLSFLCKTMISPCADIIQLSAAILLVDCRSVRGIDIIQILDTDNQDAMDLMEHDLSRI